MILLPAPDPIAGTRLAGEIEAQTAATDVNVTLVGDEIRVTGDGLDEAEVRAVVDAHDGTTEPRVDPDAELDDGLAEVAARTDVPEWGQALIDTLRGQAGHAGRAAGRRPE